MSKAITKENVCPTCGKMTLENNSSDDLMEVMNNNEEKIISSITKKAIKETMIALKPLLDKLEEATKQQSNESASSPEFNYQDEVNKMKTIANEKIKMQEFKISERMKNLQAKISKRI